MNAFGTFYTKYVATTTANKRFRYFTHGWMEKRTNSSKVYIFFDESQLVYDLIEAIKHETDTLSPCQKKKKQESG